MRGIPSSCHLNILCSLTRGQLLIDSIHSLTCLQRHISETWVKVQAQRHCVDRGQLIAAARGKGFFFPVIFLKETWLKHLCWIPSGSEQGIPGFISRTLKLMDKIWTFYWGKGALLTSTWPLVCPRNHCYLRAPGLGLARSNSQQRAGAGGCLAGQYKLSFGSTSHGGTVNWEADAQLPPVYFHTQWYLSETEGPSLNRLTRNLFPVFFWYRISFCRCLYGTKAIKTKTLLCHLYAQQRRLTVLPWQPKSTRSLLTSHNEVCVWEEVFCLHQGPGMSRVKQVKYSIGVNSDRAIHCAKETDRQTFVKMPSWRSSCCSCMHMGTFWNSGGSCRKLAEYRATARKHLWKEMAGSFPSHMETNTAEKRAEIEPYLKTDSKSTTCLPWRDTMGKANSEYLPPTEI